MAVRSWMAGAAAMILAAGAVNAAVPGPENNPTASGLPLSAQEIFKSLSGEFTGTVQKLAPDGTLAKATASASNKTENNGRTLVSAFEWSIDSETTDGAVLWTVPSSGRAASTWSFEDTPFSATGKFMNREMTFTGQPAASTGHGTKVEQTVSVLNLNRYQIAFNRIEANGAKTLVMHLDMSRMQDGKKSTASTKVSSSRAIAVAKSALEGVQKTAGANEP